MQNSPYLIVGHSGQLATDLMRVGNAFDYDVVAVGRPQCDLTDPHSPHRLLERVMPCAVINAGAYTNVDLAESDKELAFAVNASGAQTLAQACASHGIPLIHVSTDQVFDGTKQSAYCEDDEPNPLCIYGASKWEGEKRVLEAHPNALIVRVSWVYGPSGNNFLTKVCEWARKNKEISIISDQTGCPTYSPDLASALLNMAKQMTREAHNAPRGLLHLAGADVMSRFEQAQMIMDASRKRGGVYAHIKPVLTRDFPTPAQRPLNATLNSTRALAQYGVQLGGFEKGLEETLNMIMQ